MPASNRPREASGSCLANLKVLGPLAFVLWGLGVLGGFAFQITCSDSAGDHAVPPPYWPPSSTIPQPRHRPTLLVFLDSHCACSRATLGELDRVLAEADRRPEVWILAVSPSRFASDSGREGLWGNAQINPGVRVLADHDGAEARRFRVSTSGTAILYDALGCLSYYGGITPAQGQEGDNVGRSSIVNLLSGRPPLQTRTPVYGCPICSACAGPQ